MPVFFALLWLNALIGGPSRKKTGMTAGVCREAYKRLEGVNSVRRFGRIGRISRIGRMWEGHRYVLGYKRDSGETHKPLLLS